MLKSQWFNQFTTQAIVYVCELDDPYVPLNEFDYPTLVKNTIGVIPSINLYSSNTIVEFISYYLLQCRKLNQI
jgi:hypothetical protein